MSHKSVSSGYVSVAGSDDSQSVFSPVAKFPMERSASPQEYMKRVTDLCCRCGYIEKKSTATHICQDCSDYGRYYCTSCLQEHSFYLEDHTVKSLSSPRLADGLRTKIQTLEGVEKAAQKTTEKMKDLTSTLVKYCKDRDVDIGEYIKKTEHEQNESELELNFRKLDAVAKSIVKELPPKPNPQDTKQITKRAQEKKIDKIMETLKAEFDKWDTFTEKNDPYKNMKSDDDIGKELIDLGRRLRGIKKGIQSKIKEESERQTTLLAKVKAIQIQMKQWTLSGVDEKKTNDKSAKTAPKTSTDKNATKSPENTNDVNIILQDIERRTGEQTEILQDSQKQLGELQKEIKSLPNLKEEQTLEPMNSSSEALLPRRVFQLREELAVKKNEQTTSRKTHLEKVKHIISEIDKWDLPKSTKQGDKKATRQEEGVVTLDALLQDIATRTEKQTDSREKHLKKVKYILSEMNKWGLHKGDEKAKPNTTKPPMAGKRGDKKVTSPEECVVKKKESDVDDILQDIATRTEKQTDSLNQTKERLKGIEEDIDSLLNAHEDQKSEPVHTLDESSLLVMVTQLRASLAAKTHTFRRELKASIEQDKDGQVMGIAKDFAERVYNLEILQRSKTTDARSCFELLEAVGQALDEFEPVLSQLRVMFRVACGNETSLPTSSDMSKETVNAATEKIKSWKKVNDKFVAHVVVATDGIYKTLLASPLKCKEVSEKDCKTSFEDYPKTTHEALAKLHCLRICLVDGTKRFEPVMSQLTVMFHVACGDETSQSSSSKMSTERVGTATEKIKSWKKVNDKFVAHVATTTDEIYKTLLASPLKCKEVSENQCKTDLEDFPQITHGALTKLHCLQICLDDGTKRWRSTKDMFFKFVDHVTKDAHFIYEKLLAPPFGFSATKEDQCKTILEEFPPKTTHKALTQMYCARICLEGGIERCMVTHTDDVLRALQSMFHQVSGEEYPTKRLKGNVTDVTEDMSQILVKRRVTQKDVDSLTSTVRKHEKYIDELLTEKDDLATRLSRVAGAALRDNNPNIADLSDSNRPTKLAEIYSELYDNIWTDAFDTIQKQQKGGDDTGIIKILYGILEETFDYCNGVSGKQLAAMETIVLYPTKGTDTTKEKKKKMELPAVLSTGLADIRKSSADLSIDDIKGGFKPDEKSQYTGKAKNVKAYTDACLQLCWRMSLQTPPVVLDFNTKTGSKLDTDKYKFYTQSGKKIAYVVWPAMHLHDGGGLLSKGVAQGH